jgi:hypothetical protein
MAASAGERLRAGRLRKKQAREGGLSAAESKWLDWYDRAHPPPQAPPPEDGSEPVEPSGEPPPPLVSPEPSYVPGAAQRATRSDIVDDALRSAVNAQVASLEMMERTCAMLLDHSRAMSASHISLTEQLVDALTMLAERVHDDAAERDAPEAASASDAVVTQLIERMGGKQP